MMTAFEPRIFEATALPTEPQPMPFYNIFDFSVKQGQTCHK